MSLSSVDEWPKLLKFVTYICAHKDHVEGNTKSRYQYKWQVNQPQECTTNTKEHVDWASYYVGRVFEDEDKVEPGEEYCNCTYLPLPNVRAPVMIVKAIDEDQR